MTFDRGLKLAKLVVPQALLILFGLLFCLIPSKSLSVLEMVISSCTLVYGLVLILGFCFSPVFLREVSMLIEGMVIFIFGLLLDFFPTLFVIGMGIIITILGVRHFFEGLALRKDRNSLWWVDLAMGLVEAGLGLASAILCGTSAAENLISIFLGLTMIFSGALNLLAIFWIRREFLKMAGEANSRDGENAAENNLFGEDREDGESAAGEDKGASRE